LLNIAEAPNMTVEIINAPEIKPQIPVKNNDPIIISFFMFVLKFLCSINKLSKLTVSSEDVA
jgi:hypothetical protein